MKAISTIAAACAALTFAASAADATDFEFSYAYGNVSASGIFSGTAKGNGSYLITNASGSRVEGGVADKIIGVAPPSRDDFTDNLLFPNRAIPVTDFGIVYNLASGTKVVLFDNKDLGGVHEFVNFETVRPNAAGFVLSIREVTGAVPEPATWGMMLLGFGLIGAAARRRLSRRGSGVPVRNPAARSRRV